MIEARLETEAEQLLREFDALGPALFSEAQRLCREGHGRVVTYSPKVFIPVTRLCRDVCGYCTFVRQPSQLEAAYLSVEEVLALCRQAKAAGCTEALFTLGDKPELRYAAARTALDRLGHATTIDYVAALCEIVLRETGLLPHVNAGVMGEADLAKFRRVSVSQGLMLEQVAPALMEKGGVHFGSPDKDPALRLATIEAAGRLAIPFTSGILIGIGETRRDRIVALLALRETHLRHGHIQEIIVQNFRAKPRTRMAGAAEPGLDDLLWTAAAARLILGPAMNIQVPPNLSYADYPRLLEAGINDWGGISPVTPDHVNPEAPWPEILALRDATERTGRDLMPRLAIYPEYLRPQWLDPAVRGATLRLADTDGFGRDDGWSPGLAVSPPAIRQSNGPVSDDVARILAAAGKGKGVAHADIVRLFRARGADERAVIAEADRVRRERAGDRVGYVVNRNINYTNLCLYACRFCAFSKGKASAALRGTPYDLDLDEMRRRAREAWERGATEVCMQGGIHPDYSGETYLSLLRAVKEEQPELHVHAFSPLEVMHGAQSLGITVAAFLARLAEAGLGSLPGTAAEILVDEVRAVICPDKLTSGEWLSVIGQAHRTGLRTTATIMFGHMESLDDWARHLTAIRTLQDETHGFTEFVPLPFVHMEAPLYHRGGARKGPTFREALLMIAVSRLALAGSIDNIQASWVKMGREGVLACLDAGANDLGGTLMNESISRAAGTEHGQEITPAEMEAMIVAHGREPFRRTTLYGAAPDGRLAHADMPLAPVVLPAAGKYARVGSRHGLASAGVPR